MINVLSDAHDASYANPRPRPLLDRVAGFGLIDQRAGALVIDFADFTLLHSGSTGMIRAELTDEFRPGISAKNVDPDNE
jgi:hypothetical protein